MNQQSQQLAAPPAGGRPEGGSAGGDAGGGAGGSEGPNPAPGKAALAWIRKITDSALYARVSGILPAALFFLMLLREVRYLAVMLQQTDLGGADALVLASVTAAISKILFLSLIVALFLIRRRPTNRAHGLTARITAIAGTFLILFIFLIPAPPPSVAQSVIGLFLVGAGNALSMVSSSFLGRSFSIMAEARKLVTGGVYSLVRHPLYLAEELAVIGILVQQFSLATLALVLVHGLLQLRRMTVEEGVLDQAFPEYAAYTARTRRLIPGLY